MTQDRQERLIEANRREALATMATTVVRGPRSGGPHFRLPPTAVGAALAADGAVALEPCSARNLGLAAAAKRALDVILAVGMLAIFGLPMLAVALLIRLTSR